MVQQTFENPEIAKEIGRVTYPVWIDAGQRPDLVARYGLGALPSIAVLTSDLAWITGSTFVGPEDMTALLRRIRILNDVPERLMDVERERRRLLARRPIPVDESATSLGLRDLVDNLRRRISEVSVADRSGEAELFLQEAGAQETSTDWVSHHLSQSRRDASGLLVSAVLSENGPLRDETVSLRSNVGILYAVTRMAGDDGVLKRMAADLGSTILRESSEDDELFHAGWADFSIQDANGRVQPNPATPRLVDRRTFTVENALLASALCWSEEHAERVGRILDRLWCRVDENGVSRTGLGSEVRQLEDVAHFSRALLDYAKVAGEETYVDSARTLIDRALSEMSSSELAHPTNHLQLVDTDDRFGSGVGVLAQCLIRLGLQDANPVYLEAAENMCRKAVATNMERVGRLGAVSRALLMLLDTEAKEG